MLDSFLAETPGFAFGYAEAGRGRRDRGEMMGYSRIIVELNFMAYILRTSIENAVERMFDTARAEHVKDCGDW